MTFELVLLAAVFFGYLAIVFEHNIHGQNHRAVVDSGALAGPVYIVSASHVVSWIAAHTWFTQEQPDETR